MTPGISPGLRGLILVTLSAAGGVALLLVAGVKPLEPAGAIHPKVYPAAVGGGATVIADASHAPPGWTLGIAQPTRLIVMSTTRAMVTLNPDGTVELGQGVTRDDAARAFWKAVENSNPLTGEVEQLRAQLNARDCWSVPPGPGHRPAVRR